ncbi:amino acid/polyamine/organocation transporter, APC superfamily [Caminicella sporogenes DSM 14501]|uniref:Amino acid/polyamine/organocation transporter, APC superfamily n=1 Tax=Caminicella sporogenes DSM 14501 TaxID=1121266 RepID=A0A1M6MHK0_9FIRM|nr:glutamate/gamma-aminobutyrate family transporter YjeM [Caminicella sporogenes]RKD27547.1 glutamate/gamma-aminobutyrate family transporter YjeM [Caminicella sporogenes]WIF94876.1 glutamate/gamma-aminobutyrate family transporter YjeM [Caminicella sporogenes]SHJ82927.1 amino acid/polyamine/organocation transporter, APC superfamily [Caminicella sporogenes DSM 14501]
MSTNVKSKNKLTLVSLVLMIFTSVFGFANMPRAFYLMGYAAIPWYVLSALTFFVPFAFMMAEYGAAFKNETGGIYSWMSKSVGPKYAFIGTFMWYASYIIWMVNVGSSIWIVFSTAIFGTDTTSSWSIFGLSSTQTLGILGVMWILLVTYISTKGLEKIKKITSIGGTAVALLNIVLLLGAIAVLVGNGGQLAQPINSIKSFTNSPNPDFQNIIAILGFLVFAIFAYGGTEVTGGLVDQTENPEKTFPKGITIAAIVISVGYAIGIFFIGIFTNFSEVLNSESVNMGNVAYIIMNNLGYQLGQAFGLSEAASISIGNWIGRYVGISMLLALTGAFFTLTYSPLKQIINGTPKEIWPGKMGEIKDGIPKNAMWIQCIIVIVMILLVSFGGDTAKEFFEKLVLMTNVAMTLPYMFISGAFIGFKNKTEIKKPFEVFKTRTSSIIASVVVTLTVGFANFFTIIQPATEGDIKSTIWSIIGPLFFTLVAILMFNRYEKKVKLNSAKQKLQKTA